MNFPLLAILLACCTVPAISGARFVCYYPNWSQYRAGNGQFSVANINPNLCTHLMYAFAVLDPTTYTVKIYDTWADLDLKGYAKFVALKAQNPNLKTMISIGGWTDSQDGSGKYSALASSSTRIATFVNSVMSFLQLYGFDGMDLDWEYPVAADKAGYTKLIAALRAAFNTRGYLLSAAVSADAVKVANGYDLVAMSQSMDFVNLMTYDMHGTWETSADNQAPLYKRSWETVNNNVNYTVNYYVKNGFPAAKMNLGIPIYGHAWTLSSSVKTPPAPASGAAPAGPITSEAGTLAYSEICSNVRFNGWTVVQDPLRQTGPYAYSPTSPKYWVGYDDPAFAVVKSNYALSMGLGGAMVWDISEDDFRNTCGGGANPMLTAISQVMLSGNPATTTTSPVTTKGTTLSSVTTKGTTSTTKATTTATTPKTTTKPSGTFTCPSPNGLFADPVSCTNFYNCGGGIAYRMSCGTGTVFNPTGLYCDWPYNVPSCSSSG